MLYLDTGCLLKLYYPEPESAAVATAVRGEVIFYTDLHELEMMTAMQLKVFRGEAKTEQVDAVMALVREDMAQGKLSQERVDWHSSYREATRMSQNHADQIGCRSLDILHCAVAKVLAADLFLSTDARQISLAKREAMPVIEI